MYLATTLNSVPGNTLTKQVTVAKRAGLHGIRVSNLDLDFTELHRVVIANQLDVTSIQIEKGWRPNSGSWILEERQKSEAVFLQAISSGVPLGFKFYSTSIETGFFENEIKAQIAGMRISLSNILGDSQDFFVTARPKQDDLFYYFAESADHATDLMIHYIDCFHSSKVALDFDVGIHSMYGDPVKAICKLGSRIRTITVTSYSRSTERLCSLTDCDLDWKGIGDSLRTIHFEGALVLSFRGVSEANFRSQIEHFATNVYPILT